MMMTLRLIYIIQANPAEDPIYRTWCFKIKLCRWQFQPIGL